MTRFLIEGRAGQVSKHDKMRRFSHSVFACEMALKCAVTLK